MKTLTQFLIEERRRFPGATGELNGLLLSVALACKSIATKVGQGALAGVVGANEAFVRSIEWGGHAVALASEEMEAPLLASHGEGGKYLLAFDPLDGASNIDLNVAVGSIFSILRSPSVADFQADRMQPFLQPGTAQVAAGYAIYGPSTMLVLSVGDGTHAFTLERSIGEFVLTHRNLRIPQTTAEFAIDSSNHRFRESLVAEAHRILMRGGVSLPERQGRFRLLYEANPLGFLVEQAGGRASTGRVPILGVAPAELHQRVGFVFGSRDEVERIERYHAEAVDEAGFDSPLFQPRGLFRDSVSA